MEKAHSEKRKYTRLPLSLKVKYTLDADAYGAQQETISRNISQGGILLSTATPPALSAKVSLQISAPRLSKPMSVEGKVIWAEEIKENKLYDVGVAFTKINARDAQFIQRYTRTLDLNRILNHAVTHKASDIHLCADQPPFVRISGNLTPMQGKPLTPEEVKDLIYGFLSEEQIARFENNLELDTAYMTDFGRFRVNIHQEKGQLGAAFRHVSTEIRSIQELGLPDILEELARKPNGLILVTGPTGSGKSTTLAAMIDLVNKEKHRMIISLEDPIEYLHKSKKSVIKQREIGFDTHSFVNALKFSLRQNVDIIMVGEMRDIESIAIALTAAETGHLVLSTMNTSDSASTINRVIDIFPATQQQQIRLQLAEALRGVICQLLIPKADKPLERAVATEIMVGTPAVANLIRQGQTEQLVTAIQVGQKYGMHLMDTSLEQLYKQGIISRENALAHAKDQSKFQE